MQFEKEEKARSQMGLSYHGVTDVLVEGNVMMEIDWEYVEKNKLQIFNMKTPISPIVKRGC